MDSNSPILNEEEQIENWTGSCNDIHDQKIAFEMLELERDVRERVIGALTHDLRTPLAAAKINAQLLTRRVPSEEMLNKVVNRISNNIDRADKMIQDILDASQIKAGEKIPLDTKKYDLNELIMVTVDNLQNIHGPRRSSQQDETTFSIIIPQDSRNI